LWTFRRLTFLRTKRHPINGQNQQYNKNERQNISEFLLFTRPGICTKYFKDSLGQEYVWHLVRCYMHTRTNTISHQVVVQALMFSIFLFLWSVLYERIKMLADLEKNVEIQYILDFVYESWSPFFTTWEWIRSKYINTNFRYLRPCLLVMNCSTSLWFVF
jgi:hypothetical protein